MYINKIINRHEMAAKDTTFVREIATNNIHRNRSRQDDTSIRQCYH